MLPASVLQNNHLCSIYFAPRGRDRLYSLGMQIAQQYLTPFDKLIGVIGEAGSGKSVLTKAMFPGLELTNDDNGVNIRPLPLLDQDAVQKGFYSPHTYHVDIRFEMGFTQPFELADAILQTDRKGKRVVVEHFDLIYPFLMGANAQLLIGVGEEIIVTRPNVFGPDPREVANIVHRSFTYRKMAHTAEDLCEFFLPEEILQECRHSDVRHGFVMAFQHKRPDVDLEELERKVKDAIERNVEVDFLDEGHVSIDGHPHPCTGPRTHVHTTGEITNFRLEKEFAYDDLSDQYLLVGRVGEKTDYTEVLAGLL